MPTLPSSSLRVNLDLNTNLSSHSPTFSLFIYEVSQLGIMSSVESGHVLRKRILKRDLIIHENSGCGIIHLLMMCNVLMNVHKLLFRAGSFLKILSRVDRE